MQEESKTLMDELAIALEKMPNDPQGIAGWLLDNYRLEKVGTGEPTGFHRKPSAGKHVGSVAEGTRVDNSFAERAGVNKLRQQGGALSKYQSVIAEINGEMGEESGEDLVEKEEKEMIRKAASKAASEGRKMTMADVLAATNEEVEITMLGSSAPLEDAEVLTKVALDSAYSHLPDSYDDLLARSGDPSVQRNRLNRLANQSKDSGQKRVSRG